ncbi:hypothetical protein ALI144C_49635 [Actinosynnema sp. ALI-1.44]|nr:hypothetical protein ALI144C_49635 [Actinosynnema sp. ALI-1.44]
MSVSRRICAGYSAGSLVTGSSTTAPGLLLLPYLTDSLAVPAATAGLRERPLVEFLGMMYTSPSSFPS